MFLSQVAISWPSNEDAPRRQSRRSAPIRPYARKLRENLCGLRGQAAEDQPSALVEEDLGMLAGPHSAALPILPDDDAEPHAGATVAVLAGDAQAQHAIAQFVAHHRDRRRRRSGHWGPAIL